MQATKELTAADLIGKPLKATNAQGLVVYGEIVDGWGNFKLTKDCLYKGQLLARAGDDNIAGNKIIYTAFPQWFIDKGELEIL